MEHGSMTEVVIVDSNNRVVVSDFCNHSIQIFNKVGGWLVTIDGKGTDYKCSSFMFPKGSCLRSSRKYSCW